MYHPSQLDFFNTLFDEFPNDCVTEPGRQLPLPDAQVEATSFADSFLYALEVHCDLEFPHVLGLEDLFASEYAFLRDYMPIEDLTLRGLLILTKMELMEYRRGSNPCTRSEFEAATTSSENITFSSLDLVYLEIYRGIKRVPSEDDPSVWKTVLSGLRRKDGVCPCLMRGSTLDGRHRGFHIDEDESLGLYTDYLLCREGRAPEVQSALLQICTALSIILDEDPHKGRSKSYVRLAALYDVELLNKQLQHLDSANEWTPFDPDFFDAILRTTLYRGILDPSVSPSKAEHYAMLLTENMENELERRTNPND